MPRRADTLFPQDPDELKTLEEVAEALGSTPEAIRKYINRGVLPAVDQRLPGQRGKPRKMVRAGDIYLLAFRPRWETHRKAILTPSGKKLYPTSLPEDSED